MRLFVEAVLLLSLAKRLFVAARYGTTRAVSGDDSDVLVDVLLVATLLLLDQVLLVVRFLLTIEGKML